MIGWMGVIALQIATAQAASITSSDEKNFHSYCDAILASANASQNGASEVYSHCKSAQGYLTTYHASNSLWKTWLGVATVCGAACGGSLVGDFYHPWVCPGASVAGGIEEARQTKQVQGLFYSVLSSAGTYAITRMTHSTAKDASRKQDIGACIQTAQALTKVLSHRSGLPGSATNFSTELGNAKNTQSTAQTVATRSLIKPGTGNDDSITASGARTGASNLSQNNPNASPQKTLCDGSRVSGSFSAEVACAAASDPGLPGFVRNPKFPSEMERLSGLKIPDLLNENKSPAQSGYSALGGGLSEMGSKKMVAALKQAQDQFLENNVSGSMYASGGGAAPSGDKSDGSDANIEELMQGVMNQLGTSGSEGQANKQPGVKQLAFNQPSNRAPASQVEYDPSVSLFERVTKRYSIIKDQNFEIK